VSALENRKGGSLVAASQKKIVETTRRLFTWAKTTFPQVFSKLPANWIDTLRPLRLPQQASEHVYVTLEEVLRLTSIQCEVSDLALQRDQAAAAMLYLSGMRTSAFSTLPLSAVCLTDKSIKQWPELSVKTKNGKRATTFLLPIPELLAVAERWDNYIRSRLPPTARWYTPVESRWGEQVLSEATPGKNRNHAVDKRLQVLYQNASLPFKSAHKFRHGHAVYGLRHALTMADYKAVSMNLMHEDIKITDQAYAPILTEEVGKRIAGMSNGPADNQENDLVAQFQNLDNIQLTQALLAIADRLRM
jgi:integrase